MRNRVPLTIRGGGTGNYGQSVPLQGGIVLDMTRYDKVTAIEPGRIRVQAGAFIQTALEAALKSGQQLMMYPSTMKVATIGVTSAADSRASARCATASSATPA